MIQRILPLLLCLLGCASAPSPTARAPELKPLVLTTDFSLKDGAVSEMKGVAYGVSSHLLISDLTHEIPPYNIWEAGYRLQQTYKYWPAGTVFVTVVDPGVGSARRSMVLLTKTGHYFVGPDNGHLTLVMDEAGIESVRILDENLQRRQGSEESYTFHGRDLYVYVGARLASGVLSYADAGPESRIDALVRLPYQKAEFSKGALNGTLPVLDPNYGNVWTNIPKGLVREHFPTAKEFHVVLRHGQKKVYEARLPLVDTFASVPKGHPLLYFNSLLNLSLALNMDDFAKHFKIQSGPEWSISVD